MHRNTVLVASIDHYCYMLMFYCLEDAAFEVKTVDMSNGSLHDDLLAQSQLDVATLGVARYE